MIRLTRTQLGPIGVDIGRDAVKLMQLEATGTSLSARAMCRMPMPPEARTNPQLRREAGIELAREAMRRGGFSGRRCVLALPREMVHLKNFRMPVMPAEEMASAIQYEARNLFGFDTEGARMQFIPAGEVRQGSDTLQEVLVFAALNDEIDSLVEQLHAAGIEIDSLDVAPAALFRSIERFIRRREDEQEVHVLLDVGAGATQIVIGRGRDISFVKTIDIGGMQLQDAVGARLGIPQEEAAALRRRMFESTAPEEEGTKKDSVEQAVFDATRGVMEQLAREVSLCLRYQSVTFRGQRPTRLRLLGGEACDRNLQSTLNSVLTIPVEAARPLYSVDLSHIPAANRHGPLGEYGVALGLALRRTVGRFAPRDGKPRALPAVQIEMSPMADAEMQEASNA